MINMDYDRFLNCSTGLRTPVFIFAAWFCLGVRGINTHNDMHELRMSPYGSARTVTRLIPIIERLKE
jgi:hypothetical protein